MDQNPITMVRSLYEAFGSGDVDRVATLMKDIHWEEAEGMPYGGVYRGAEQVFQHVFAPIAADVEGFSARPDEILSAGDDRVLALGRYRGKGANGDVDVAFAHLWTVEDGTIARFVQYADTHKFRQAIAR